MPETFAAFMAMHKPAIDKGLTGLLRQQSASIDKTDPYSDFLDQLGSLIARGGKRLRPLLCLLAYEGYGGTRTKPALQAALSQELLHAFLLIHDDIIDRDFQRWGGQNVHGVYFDRYSKTMTPSEALHYAEAQALLAGDTCLTLANQTLLGSDFDPVLLVAAGQLQQQLVQQVIHGEVSETSYALDAELLTEAQILDIYRHKTASYSFSLPLRLGALLAGAPAAEHDNLAILADDLGIAFQLQDDLLGSFGSTKTTGKSTTGDLREGKKTLLITKALELADPPDSKRLLAVLGNTEATSESLLTAKAILINSGARDYVTKLAADYARQASAKLKNTKLTALAQACVQDLITQLTTRDH